MMEHSKYRWQKQRRCRATASLPLLMVLVLFASSAECFAGLGSTTGWATGASSRGFRVQAPPLATHSQRRRSAKCALRMSDEVVFEKDVVEFLIPPDLRVQLSEAGIAGGDAAETMLGAIVDELGPSVAPLSVREEGSGEFYADSRLEPIILPPNSIKNVVDAFPSQRPIPSLGGGIGYGAEGIDCWQVDDSLADSCLVPVEDTGMGFHQKGWS